VRTRIVVCALVLGLVGTTGCTAALRNLDAPLCDLDVGNLGATPVLMAQAVPSSELLPCIQSYPNGWEFGELFVRDGLARFTLHHDRAGTNAVRVTLTERCEVTGLDQISSDEDGADRYEAIERVRPFRAVWRYRFPGGCVEYDFRFSEGDSSLLTELAVALGFVTRDEVRENVEKNYPGDVTL
jgi:hypothetical protein